MLKRKALRKIIITTFSIITLLVICIIPGKLNNNKNFLNPNIETIYVGNINGNEIYLLSKNNYLAATNVIITEENIVDKIRKIVEYLTINKSSKIPNGLSAIINEATVLNDVYVEKGIAILNFSSNLLNTTPEMERKIIESLTYSLINLDGIEGIKILIDDNILAKLPQTGEKLPDVLNRSFGINKKYEINSINDTSKITMYYLNDINGVFYSIPVTKYLNDDRDKIKVIIDNLSSTYLYEPSLISLVSQNTKLIAYELENNKMMLDFSDDILINDVILEEVIYQITESVFENYDVDDILLKVNGSDWVETSKCCGNKFLR